MLHRFLTSLLFVAAGTFARGDEILYQYEGDVLPYDAAAGWLIADSCAGACSESTDAAQFVLNWTFGDLVNYHYWLAQPPVLPPSPPFWVEWRFRSNVPKPPSRPSCDADFVIRYVGVSEVVYLFGDTATSYEGGDSISGLELDVFHTFRFETEDGLNYTVSADGTIFISDACPSCADEFHYFQFGGQAACNPGLRTNAWDYIRWGTSGTLQSIISANPAPGFLDPDEYTGLDRFTITLNEPGYVYIEDIAVTVSNGTAPIILKTWRKDGFSPRQLEIVLDRPLTLGVTTTFTFTGLNPNANVVSYRLLEPIPATSAWSAIVAALGLAVAGTVVFRLRQSTPQGARSRVAF